MEFESTEQRGCNFKLEVQNNLEWHYTLMMVQRFSYGYTLESIKACSQICKSKH